MPDLEGASQEPMVYIGPDTETLAERMLLNAQMAADLLPHGLNCCEPFELLLKSYAAEGRAEYLSVDTVSVPSSLSRPVTLRWVRALVAEKLMDQRGRFIALTPEGHVLVKTILERIYAAQRCYR
jgi:hypothetical protein